jgi:hypothetical protein
MPTHTIVSMEFVFFKLQLKLEGAAAQQPFLGCALVDNKLKFGNNSTDIKLK